MQNEIPVLAKGTRMVIDRTTGMPSVRRGIYTIDIRPGLGQLKFYHVIIIPDIGVLVMMSDEAHTRYYLFHGYYRGSVLCHAPTQNKREGLLALKETLGLVGEEEITQNTKLFRNRIIDWLLDITTPHPELALCGRRMFINRLTGKPVTRAVAKTLGYIVNDRGQRSWLVGPCVDTYLTGKIIAYFAFQLEQGTLAVVSTGTVTNYIFLGNGSSPYAMLRARFKVGVTTEELARTALNTANGMSNPTSTGLIKHLCKNLATAPLLTSIGYQL